MIRIVRRELSGLPEASLLRIQVQEIIKGLRVLFSFKPGIFMDLWVDKLLVELVLLSATESKASTWEVGEAAQAIVL